MQLRSIFTCGLLAAALVGCGDDNSNGNNAPQSQPPASENGSTGNGGNNGGSNGGNGNNNPTVARAWATITMEEGFGEVMPGACQVHKFVVNADRNYRLDRCGDVKTGLVDQDQFDQLDEHMADVARENLSATPTCLSEAPADYNVSIDVQLKGESAKRVYSQNSVETCYIGERSRAEHLSEHLSAIKNRETRSETAPD